MKRLALLLLLLSLSASASKAREWKSGVLKSFTQERTDIHNSTTINHLEISDGDTSYFADQYVKFMWQHGPKLTENGKIQWVLDGDNLFIFDDTGKEFKLKLLKKRKN